MILLDADRDCPKHLAAQILARARAARSDRSIRVVLAKVESEAWFLAAAESIAGRRGIQTNAKTPENPEEIPDPKAWLNARMETRSYRETLDQPALTAIFDLESARRAASFDKMRRDIESLRDA